MSLILSIDTSTRSCSVALHEFGRLLSCYELCTDRSSSGMLTVLIQSVVENTGHTLANLDAIAVAKGPGSYTGLRIAVSTAKGLCFALDKPLIAINTLAAMTCQVRPYFDDTHLFCPMIDARRMEVYCAVFDAGLQAIDAVQAKIIDEAAFGPLLERQKMVFFGDGAAKCKDLLQYQPNAFFVDKPILPSAHTMGELAVQAFDTGQFEDVATFEPYYLKEFMATTPKKLL